MVLAALLAAAYVAFFTDWFRSGDIRLSYRFFAGDRSSAGAPRVVIYVVPKQPMASLKVYPAAEADSPKSIPIWHMVADKSGKPVSSFAYGEPVPGMKPFVSGIVPGPLVPGGEYIVRVEMGKKRGELKFAVPTE